MNKDREWFKYISQNLSNFSSEKLKADIFDRQHIRLFEVTTFISSMAEVKAFRKNWILRKLDILVVDA